MNGLEKMKEMEAPKATLGALYTKKETCFRTWAPGAKQVAVKLYSCGTPEESMENGGYIRTVSMKTSKKQEESWVWEVTILGDCHGIYYTYEIIRDDVVKECIDIYARASGANGIRGMVVNLLETNPEGWEKDKEWKQENTNTIIYELHVKDFSYHQSSGIPREHRGKYIAFTDKTAKNRGVNYLRNLGISHVHLLPIFDFASIDETGDLDQFNWGYDPLNYNVPEGSYSTNPYQGDVRIRELKQMIQALHRAGIGVIMDVVYNHTYSTEGSFQVLAPNYYYRQQEDGSFANGSACGNEIACERVMCRKFIIESLLYWAKEYHLDGFRFDLMGLHDVEMMNEIHNQLKQRIPGKEILLYGEPWSAGSQENLKDYLPAIKKNMDKMSEIAIFSDDTRDALKGSVFVTEEPGFVNGGKDFERKIGSAYKAWCDKKHDFQPTSPKQIITYVSAHDNHTLWDKLILTSKSQDFITKDEKILARNKLSAGIIFTCLGTPFFLAGEEFGRTKYGDENSYQSSASINCLDWNRMDVFQDLHSYYRGLIGLRKQIPIYQEQQLENVKKIHILFAEKQIVVVNIDLSEYQTRWKQLYIIANASAKTATTALPKGNYQTLVNHKSSWLWKANMKHPQKSSYIANTAPMSIEICGELNSY